jgi:hypothetical protein
MRGTEGLSISALRWALVIDEQARAKARQIREFAEQPENWYQIDGGDRELKIPGNDPRYVACLNTYRCVFWITKALTEAHRHLSISVPSGGFPNPYAAFLFAQLFGFEGWDGKTLKPGPDWIIQANHAEHCVVFACPYPPVAEKKMS